MSKLRLLLLLVVAATAIAAAPGVASADTVTPVCDGGSCGSGWHTSPVHVTWTFDPDPPDSTTCAPLDIGEPQSGQTFSCDATWAGNTVSGSVSQLVDTHAPTFGGVGPDRPPDFNGWYNHPVTFGFSWDGGTSGLGSCQTSVPYSGASGTGLHVSSSCSDGAGNGAGPVSSPAFNYDAGPPTDVVGGTSRPPDHNGWFNHALTIAFTGADPASGVTCTSSTYSGPDN